MKTANTADRMTANDEQYDRILTQCRKMYGGRVLAKIEILLMEERELGFATWNDLVRMVGGISGRDMWKSEIN